MSKNYKIAVIPGDGTGPEVIAEAVKVIDAAGSKFGFTADKEFIDWGGEHYLATGEILPDDACDTLRGFDAMGDVVLVIQFPVTLCGAVDPDDPGNGLEASRQALKDAGIDKIIEEAEAQYKIWKDSLK